jgi:hypothetical protein
MSESNRELDQIQIQQEQLTPVSNNKTFRDRMTALSMALGFSLMPIAFSQEKAVAGSPIETIQCTLLAKANPYAALGAGCGCEFVGSFNKGAGILCDTFGNIIEEGRQTYTNTEENVEYLGQPSSSLAAKACKVGYVDLVVRGEAEEYLDIKAFQNEFNNRDSNVFGCSGKDQDGNFQGLDADKSDACRLTYSKNRFRTAYFINNPATEEYKPGCYYTGAMKYAS